jgi:hypothetical protein
MGTLPDAACSARAHCRRGPRPTFMALRVAALAVQASQSGRWSPRASMDEARFEKKGTNMYTNKQQYQPRNQQSGGFQKPMPESRQYRDRVAGPLPTLTAYVVKDAPEEGGKAEWTRVGKLFAHADRKGFNLLLDRAVEGKLVVREDKPKKDRIQH